ASKKDTATGVVGHACESNLNTRRVFSVLKTFSSYARSRKAARAVVGSIMNDAIAAAVETAMKSVAISGCAAPLPSTAPTNDAENPASHQRVHNSDLVSCAGNSVGKKRAVNQRCILSVIAPAAEARMEHKKAVAHGCGNQIRARHAGYNISRYRTEMVT